MEALKRSWKPVGRMVVWELQRTGGHSTIRSMTTLTASSGSSTSWLSRVTIENSLARPASVGGGRTWESLISSPQTRFASNNSALAKDDQPEEENKVEEAKANDHLEQSEYWGVTTKTFTREDGTKWPWNCFRPGDAYTPNLKVDITKHRDPTTWNEKFALWTVKTIKIPVNLFYSTRYGCRAMMLETVAAVPGMVGGMLLHLRSLRRFEHSGGWIKALLDEAENERMHLMTLMDIVKPAWYERALVVMVQGIFFNFYFLLYVLSPRLAHRVTGYLEEEAIVSYTTFLEGIDKGIVENVPAPPIAIDYWRLPEDATLREMVQALRADEAHHRDVNHYAADIRQAGKYLHEAAAPVDHH